MDVSLLLLLTCISAVTVRAMIRVGTLDHPGARSSHSIPTPKGGGVGIVAAFVVGVGVDHAGAPAGLLAGLIGAAVGIAAVSYTDDVRNWPFSVKLAAQLAACMVAIASSIVLRVVHLPWVGAVDLGWLGVPVTAAWILFATNAVNFIDGLNGLASGTVAIACVFLAAIAGGQGDFFVRAACLALAAGIAGFLPFNFPRARIFMGDVGSQFCGFIIAVLGILAARFGAQTLSVLLVPMMLFGVLFDVAFTLLRRVLAGEPITQAHRGHLYQVANRTGMPAWGVTLVYWGMAGWGGLCCLAFADSPSAWKKVILLATVLPEMAWLGFTVRQARRAELKRW